MTVGLPAGFFYHRYGILWTEFFQNLGIQTLSSGETNRRIYETGTALTPDECCLPTKLYMGHVRALNECTDAVLTPRMVGVGPMDEFCPRFHGLYDMVRSTFPGIRQLCYELHPKQKEERSFLRLGWQLRQNPYRTIRAYRHAKAMQAAAENRLRQEQETALQSNEKKHILIIAPPYLMHDSYIAAPLTAMLQEAGASVLFSDRVDRTQAAALASQAFDDLFWITEKEALGAALLLKNQIHGAILLSAYPCGCDALTHEILERTLKGLPLLHLVVDGQDGAAGMATRIESFMDILSSTF